MTHLKMSRDGREGGEEDAGSPSLPSRSSRDIKIVRNESKLKFFWRRRVIGLIVAQLTQGVSPEKIALTIALGSTIAIFPIMGSTTLLCLIVGVWCKLNQPIIQLVN